MQIGDFDSVYRLALVASERCRRIILGEEIRTETHHFKPTYVALDEVMSGEVGVKFNKLDGEEVVIGPFPCESSSD